MANPWLTSVGLLASVSIIGAGVDHWLTPLLGPPLERNGYGLSVVTTGSRAYPREAVDAYGFRVRIPHKPARIASQGWSIDEYLYAIVPPERIVAVSESAFIKGVSNVLDEVARFKPALAADPERVLRANPDLIIVTSGSRVDFTSLVRSSGIPVYRMFIDFTTFAQIEEYIRLVGYLTGEDDRADEVALRFHGEVERAAALRPMGARRPRVLAMGGRYTYGSHTLFDDGVRLVGAVNPAAEAGLKGYDMVDSEQLARWNPEWIVAGGPPETRARILADPGVALTDAGRNGHVLVLENRVFLPMSPYSTGRLTALAEALWK